MFEEYCVRGAVRASFWRAAAAFVWAVKRERPLVVAVNPEPGEVECFP